MIDITTLTIEQVASDLRAKKYTVSELVQTYVDHIQKINPEVNAYLEVFSDVLEQAQRAQKRIDAGDTSLLIGVPVAIKDNILIEGKVSSASSRILEHYVATYDATAIKKLKDAGVVFLGRTNMDEFAMGGSTENSAFGVTKNPLDTTRVSGGSSGGSAAAVAMHGALVSLGSDTGGSVRQPASFCGVVGLKPTYGGVSRHGLMAMGSSLDVIGPIGKTVGDVEAVYQVIKGHDPLDSTTYTNTTYSHKGDKKTFTIGVPWNLLNQDGIDESVKENINTVIETLKAKGHTIVDISIPHIALSLAVYYIIMPAEVSSNLARFDGVKYGLHKDTGSLLEDYMHTRGEGFGREVRRRILLGTYVLSSGYYDAYYNKARIVQDLIRQEFEEAFKTVDMILTPTTPSPAFTIGEKIKDPLSMYLADVFTVTANIAGVPALSIPSGVVSVGGKQLPLGAQFMAPHDHESYLFTVGKDFLGR